MISLEVASRHSAFQMLICQSRTSRFHAFIPPAQTTRERDSAIICRDVTRRNYCVEILQMFHHRHWLKLLRNVSEFLLIFGGFAAFYFL